eukprot:TRINITY_DN67922_c0_g1_i1.p1 TRINITY_DN67922_c0_g1~~TRINITY_DN67922_c0_g1_i1.p1  ORF type:complete len:466 (-),score=56.18 TRINITY_DN67922_c0_g1_i1:61-1458(-)
MLFVLLVVFLDAALYALSTGVCSEDNGSILHTVYSSSLVQTSWDKIPKLTLRQQLVQEIHHGDGAADVRNTSLDSEHVKTRQHKEAIPANTTLSVIEDGTISSSGLVVTNLVMQEDHGLAQTTIPSTGLPTAPLLPKPTSMGTSGGYGVNITSLVVVVSRSVAAYTDSVPESFLLMMTGLAVVFAGVMVMFALVMYVPVPRSPASRMVSMPMPHGLESPVNKEGPVSVVQKDLIPSTSGVRSPQAQTGDGVANASVSPAKPETTPVFFPALVEQMVVPAESECLLVMPFLRRDCKTVEGSASFSVLDIGRNPVVEVTYRKPSHLQSVQSTNDFPSRSHVQSDEWTLALFAPGEDGQTRLATVTETGPALLQLWDATGQSYGQLCKDNRTTGGDLFFDLTVVGSEKAHFVVRTSYQMRCYHENRLMAVVEPQESHASGERRILVGPGSDACMVILCLFCIDLLMSN